jgi:pilus assembly protein Flp/PilA
MPGRRSAVTSLVQFLTREDGPTAVEYAVMLALVIVVCIAAITTLGQKNNQTYQDIDTALGS